MLRRLASDLAALRRVLTLRSAGAAILAVIVLTGAECGDRGALRSASLASPRSIVVCFDTTSDPGESAPDKWKITNGSAAVGVTGVAKSNTPGCYTLTLSAALDSSKDIVVTTTHQTNQGDDVLVIPAGGVAAGSGSPSPTTRPSPSATASATASVPGTPSASPAASASPSEVARTETPRTETPRTETPRTETPRTETPRTETPRTPEPTPSPTPSRSPSPSPTVAGFTPVASRAPQQNETAVTGRVLRANGQPAVNACVVLNAGPCAATTGADGRFQVLILNQPGISWTLVFYSAPGVEGARRSFAGTSSPTATLGDIPLSQ